MSNIVHFKSPSGDNLVVLTKQEYDNLVKGVMTDEDIQDVAAILNFREKLERGEEELIPASVIKRLSSGEEHPLRIWRKYRGMKARDLAKACRITAVYLSEIENRKKDGSLKVMMRLAKALNVDLDDLVDWP